MTNFSSSFKNAVSSRQQQDSARDSYRDSQHQYTSQTSKEDQKLGDSHLHDPNDLDLDNDRKQQYPTEYRESGRQSVQS